VPMFIDSRITELIELADPQRHAVREEERISAINELLEIHRTQAEEFRRGERKIVNRLLQQWLTRWGLRIFAAPDPLSAMSMFLGRAINTERDFTIAVAVATKMTSEGITLESAAVSVAERFKKSPEWIQKIYKANRIEARAHVAICWIESTP
jgi:hypothetical protein